MGISINQTTIANLTGNFDSFFQIMSTGRNSYCTVVKEPIKIISNSTPDVILPGYPTESINQTDITYEPNTGVFPCVAIYPYKSMPSTKSPEMKFDFDQNALYIKVKEDCRNFIKEGKTERIIVDNLSYTNQDIEQVQNFMGLRYYYFKLVSTQ